MIGYITLGTNDLDRAKAFYDTLLSEMGVTRLIAFGDRGYGWAASMDQPMLCISNLTMASLPRLAMASWRGYPLIRVRRWIEFTRRHWNLAPRMKVLPACAQ